MFGYLIIDAASEAVGCNEDANSFDNDPFNFDPEQVVNPYPIAFRPKLTDNAREYSARCVMNNNCVLCSLTVNLSSHLSVCLSVWSAQFVEGIRS